MQAVDTNKRVGKHAALAMVAWAKSRRMEEMMSNKTLMARVAWTESNRMEETNTCLMRMLKWMWTKRFDKDNNDKSS
jgi:hypothetical protein